MRVSAAVVALGFSFSQWPSWPVHAPPVAALRVPVALGAPPSAAAGSPAQARVVVSQLAVSALSRRSAALLAVATAASALAARRRVIDSAIHVWSSGSEPYPWAVAPPTDLREAATVEAYIASAKEAGVTGALIVQPANHMYDHAYVQRALREHADFFRGVCLANPTLSPEEALAELEALRAAGFVGVRFNAGNFQGGIASAVGKALYARAGELGMPVSLMAFKGIGPFSPALRELLEEYPATTLVIDHMGFFRQPAIGGQLNDAAKNDDASWAALLDLAKYPQVYVKVSALFRNSAEAPPFRDLEARVAALLAAFGASRLMWGSDFPFVLPGGFPLPEGVAATPAAMSYADAAAVPTRWALPELDDAALDALMGGTAAKLFGFDRVPKSADRARAGVAQMDSNWRPKQVDPLGQAWGSPAEKKRPYQYWLDLRAAEVTFAQQALVQLFYAVRRIVDEAGRSLPKGAAVQGIVYEASTFDRADAMDANVPVYLESAGNLSAAAGGAEEGAAAAAVELRSAASAEELRAAQRDLEDAAEGAAAIALPADPMLWAEALTGLPPEKLVCVEEGA